MKKIFITDFYTLSNINFCFPAKGIKSCNITKFSWSSIWF